MKKSKLLYVIIVSFLTSMGCNSSKEGNIPDAVKEAFTAKYPKEKNPDWEIDANGNFEAGFKKDGEKYRADFSPDGSWIETERSIKKKDLPRIIQDKIESDFDDEDLVEVEEVEHHEKGLFYDVEFKQKGKNKDVEFKANGQIIN